MSDFDSWSKEILKTFKSRVSIICGKKYQEVSTFLCNLASLDKYRQDMQENYETMKSVKIEDTRFQSVI